MAAPCDTLRAVLFDLDGTLIETRIDFPTMRRAMYAMAHEAGTPDDVIGGKDILGMVEAATTEVTARGNDGADFRRHAFAQLGVMEEVGCANPRLLPGAKRLLSCLSARGVKIGIVTRNCRAVSARLLSQFALPHDLLLTRDDVPLTKPNPEHLWDALRLLDAPPAQAAMVGDNFMDIQAGRAAGCALTIGVGNADRFAPCPPTYCVTDLCEALGILTG